MVTNQPVVQSNLTLKLVCSTFIILVMIKKKLKHTHTHTHTHTHKHTK